MRQGLPGRELGDAVRGQQRPQGGGQILRLPSGRGDGEHRPPGLAGQCGHGEGAGSGRADEVDMHPVAVGGGLHRFGECRVTYDDIQQTVQAHEGLPSGLRGRGSGSRLLPGGNAKGPTRITGRGSQRTTPL